MDSTVTKEPFLGLYLYLQVQTMPWVTPTISWV